MKEADFTASMQELRNGVKLSIHQPEIIWDSYFADVLRFDIELACHILPNISKYMLCTPRVQYSNSLDFLNQESRQTCFEIPSRGAEQDA